MSNTTSFLLRLPAYLSATVAELSRQTGMSQNTFIADAVRQAVGDDAQPPLVLGWIAIDRPGELSPGDGWDCPECGQPMCEPHVGIMSNGVLTRVVCGGCAVVG